MQKLPVYPAAQGLFHSSLRRGMAGGVLVAFGLMGLGVGTAFASSIGTSAPGLMRTALAGGAVASAAEVKNFAAAVQEIKPLNEQVHSALSRKGITATQREELKKSYMTKVDGILAKNHLTAEQYSSLLRQTQSDPDFAKDVEADMR
ncbi:MULTISPECIES: DUF4168 domain-containing protein [Acidithiobacillus]|uniref:DUF4168 domain-containing protein n=1 Tax=Acidithiobacillus ferruginosus TaxID=3063951 RepID=A0ACD5IFI9_9PROT|nr:DUF4168 domain-containing protein [Acidithiobacillus ferruginosus]MBU2813031.1 DUF4168 domain-containing protein [Acidithiobacillus ferruginosus]